VLLMEFCVARDLDASMHARSWANGTRIFDWWVAMARGAGGRGHAVGGWVASLVSGWAGEVQPAPAPRGGVWDLQASWALWGGVAAGEGRAGQGRACFHAGWRQV